MIRRYAPAGQFDLSSHIAPFLRNVVWNLMEEKKRKMCEAWLTASLVQ